MFTQYTMIVDIFIARRLDGSTVSVEGLHSRFDIGAPGPRPLFLPSGELVHAFAVDRRVRAVADICAGCEYEYWHIIFAEMDARYYSAEYVMSFSAHRWVRLFLLLWQR